MDWIPIAAWGVAALVALVVLGYCAYEINWKASRLTRDIADLNSVAEQLQELRGSLAETQQRLAASGLG